MQKQLAILITALSLLSCQTMMRGMGMIPMGSDEDIAYATTLWQEMTKNKLVGPDATLNKPILGAALPHGWILEIHYRQIKVQQHTGFIVVKKNYNATPNPTIEQVEKDRKKYLDSITVMFQREAGYDVDNLNWFWAKYKADGSLAYLTKMLAIDIALAGRIGKGKKQGCIPCHLSAGGGDYIFYPNIQIPKKKM